MFEANVLATKSAGPKLTSENIDKFENRETLNIGSLG